MTDSTTYIPTENEKSEFDRILAESAAREIEIPVNKINGHTVIWEPQNGSQTTFIDCTLPEALYHGTRGPGKTDGLLMTYATRVRKGYGSAWRGVIFRQTYPQLADVQAKSEKWFYQIFRGAATFNRSKMMWEWKTGEALLFRHMARPEDYWNYHGHEYPFIGWEELTNWSDDQCYKAMMACCRSSNPDVPKIIRATTNSYGVGHNWVKDRFRLGGNWKLTSIITDAKDLEGRPEPNRCAIHGYLDENKILLKADPDYKQRIIAAASNPAMAEAWLEGSWDIVAGGMFDDVWNREQNIVPKFKIPSTWRIDRSFDWGSSKPFSVSWWAESDGSDLEFEDGTVIATVRGDLFRVKEWYGWTGQPNQGVRMLATDIARGIVEREILWGWHEGGKSIVKAGPADSSIFTVENGVSIGLDMSRPIRLGNQMYKGIAWTPADKRPGSRKSGWEMVRKMMRNAHSNIGRPREHIGLFVVERENPQFIRTVLSLPRDEKDMDDIDTNAEDHIADELRYRVRSVGTQVRGGTTVGMY